MKKNSKQKKFFNTRGFNLFSALVAAIFLMTGVILVNMLVSTEETIGTEIYVMTNNFSLSDAAAIARSDALQTFNYNFRKQLEDYLTVSENDIRIGISFNLIRTEDIVPGNPEQTWEKLKDNFEKSILLKGNEVDETANTRFTASIEMVARKTIDQFHDGRYGRYHVSLSERDNTAKKKLEQALIQTLEENINEIEFLEIVGCNATTCEIGTFYFIIPLDKMSDQAYESLPMIIVKDLVTGEEIKFPLLPKTRLNIYVPLRFFKAIHETWHKNTLAIIDYEDLLDRGQTLKTAMLGYCDQGCEPRTDPLTTGLPTWNNSACIGIGGTITQEMIDQNMLLLLTRQNYTIGENNGRIELNAYTRTIICNQAIQSYSTYAVAEKLDGEGTFGNYNIDNGIGLPASTELGIKKYDACPFNRINSQGYSHQTKTLIGTGAGTKLSCVSINQVEAITIFEETNPLYTVSGENNKYAIGIRSKNFPIQNNDLGTCNNDVSQNKCI
jgi:hypothetical protein